MAKRSKSKAPDPRLVKFFMEHAGFSYDPKTETKAQGQRRSAVRLAKAYEELQIAEAEGLVEVRWEYEDDPDLSWADEKTLEKIESGEFETLQAAIVGKDGDYLASLGGIVVKRGDPYKKVVEAEMALEAGLG